jgi:hypothetical protein
MEEKFNVNDNPADYVVVPCLNMAGKTGALGKEANKKQTKNYGSLEPKSKKEVAILTKRGSFAELTIGDILEGK